MHEILLFYVPFPDLKSAESTVEELLKLKLIACANIVPVKSAYFWLNEFRKDDEVLVLMKTRTEKEEILDNKISALHTYETPCIARTVLRCNKAYYDWVCAQTAD